MIDALIGGHLFGNAQARVSKNGNPFVTVKIRTTMADGETAFISVVAFSDALRTVLLALNPGDSIALTGELKIGVYTTKEGVTRPNVSLTAHGVLTTYHVARKRKAMTEGGDNGR